MSNQYSLEDRQELVRLRFAWDQVLRSVGQGMPRATLDKFLRPLTPIGFSDGNVVLKAPGAFVVEWVRGKYLVRLQEALSDELGEPVTVELRAGSRDRSDEHPEIPTYAAVDAAPAMDRDQFQPVGKYRFETFVVGQSNRMAHAGARAVATEPGEKFNPLFIYGTSGLGKTHLLHAIAHELIKNHPRMPLVYISAQQFAEQFVQALHNNSINQFRRAQRASGIWLVDDIQFVAGKDKTQEEIFHTFNSLHQIGKQIVICSDRPPRELYLMDERLRSRFESGLVVDIQPPDTETRAAILLMKAQQEQAALSPDVALYLAENVAGNIRVLEGALAKMIVLASLESAAITMEMAADVVGKYYTSNRMAKPGFQQIVDVVGRYYKIPSDDIRGISRKAPIAHARHVAVYITREVTQDSWKHIGSLFGDRDHTSMMHAYQKIGEMRTRDKDFDSTLRELIRSLNPNS